MNRSVWGRKGVACVLAVAVYAVYSLTVIALPVPVAAELSASGQVTIDGQPAISGASVFSGSVITTGVNSSALVTIAGLGKLELAQNTSLHLNFTGGGISATLDAGKVRAATPVGVSIVISTADGSAVADPASANAFAVDLECGMRLATESGLVSLRFGSVDQRVAAGKDMTVPGQTSAGTRCTKVGTAPQFGSLHGANLAALLLAAAGAIIGAVIAGGNHNNDVNTNGGQVVVVSAAI
jgi:hypothetical protein